MPTDSTPRLARVVEAYLRLGASKAAQELRISRRQVYYAIEDYKRRGHTVPHFQERIVH